MLSEDKTGLLKNFLGGLSGDSAARLASAVEADRLLDGHVLPHEAILASLRAALRDTDAIRTPTPLRLFCRPFEDILSSAPRKIKQKASIARSSLLPVWLWLSRDLLRAKAESYITDTKALIVARKYDEAARRAESFWPEATAALQAGLKTPAARTMLGDALIVADAQEMALLLPASAEILRIQDVLVRPVLQFNEELVWQLRAIYDELVTRMPDVAPYVAVVAMNRLELPWQALRLPIQICRQHRDTLISKTDMGLVGEIIFTRMENLRDSIALGAGAVALCRPGFHSGARRRTPHQRGAGRARPSGRRLPSLYIVHFQSVSAPGSRAVRRGRPQSFAAGSRPRDPSAHALRRLYVGLSARLSLMPLPP